LAAAGLPSPAYRVCRLDDDVAHIAAELAAQDGFPCVVKPLSLAGSRGVIRADDPAALEAAVQRLTALLTRPDVIAECGEFASQYLIEGYIPGVEVALEGLLTNAALHVLALFDKPDPLVGPFFEETIYVTPSRLPAAQQRTIVARAEQAAAALEIRDGPIHVELRIADDDAWPIDIAARTIGGHCARALRFADGGSLEELVLRHAVGLPIDTFDRESAASAVMMIPIPSAGRLDAIDGVDDARAVAGVTDITMTVRPDHTLVPLPEGGEYLGFIFAKAETPQAAEAAIRRAHATLRFTILPKSAVEDQT
jgi:biotin carboxylase